MTADKKTGSSETILSLKNIYRIFTQRDYPVFSHDILKARQKKGLTILKFYEEVLISEWRTGRYGSLIFRQDGRSRFTSELLNRKADFPYYRAYQEEILYSLTPDSFLLQMNAFSRFLLGRERNPEAFRVKMQAFLSIVRKEDPFFTQKAAAYFEAYGNRQDVPDSFLDAWLLTGLFVHAASGPEMNSANLCVLYEDETYLPEPLLKRSRLLKAGSLVRELGASGSEALGEALPAALFFGREGSLYELYEAALEGGKVLIFGPGGTGKTELMRQLRAALAADHSIESLAAIRFENSLAESFARAFPGESGRTAEEKFYSFLYRVKSGDFGRMAILIDNVQPLKEERVLYEALSCLPACVILSSRRNELSGFSVIRPEPLMEDSAMRILKSRYRKEPGKEARKIVHELFLQGASPTPLALTLLARTAASGNFDLEGILKKLLMIYSSPEKDGSEECARRFIAALGGKDRLDRDERACCEILAVLPAAGFRPETVASFLPGMGTPKASAALSELVKKGWADRDGEGFRMHPLIAEIFREKGFHEKNFRTLFSKLTAHFPEYEPEMITGYPAAGAGSTEDAERLLYAASCMEKGISLRLFRHCLTAAWQVAGAFEGGRELIRCLGNLRQACPEAGWEERAAIAVIQCACENYDPEELAACMREGISTDPSSETLLHLAEYAVPVLVEMDRWQEEAERIIHEIEKAQSAPILQLLEAHITFSRLLNHSDPEGALQAFRTLQALYRPAMGRRAGNLLREAWTSLTVLLYAMKTLPEEADRLVMEYESAGFITESIPQEIMELRMCSSYEAARRNFGTAASLRREILELLEKTCGRRNRTYIISKHDLAFFLRRSGRTSEALSIYEELLADGDRENMNPDYYPRLLLNAGAACFDLKDLSRAKELFEKARETAAARNVLQLFGASSYWLSQVCRASEDPAGERAYLLESAEYYRPESGIDPERSAEIAARLAELKQGDSGNKPSLMP